MRARAIGLSTAAGIRRVGLSQTGARSRSYLIARRLSMYVCVCVFVRDLARCQTRSIPRANLRVPASRGARSYCCGCEFSPSLSAAVATFAGVSARRSQKELSVRYNLLIFLRKVCGWRENERERGGRDKKEEGDTKYRALSLGLFSLSCLYIYTSSKLCLFGTCGLLFLSLSFFDCIVLERRGAFPFIFHAVRKLGRKLNDDFPRACEPSASLSHILNSVVRS